MSKWWGSIDFELNECKCWQVGERFIAVQRKEKEWRVWNVQTKEETSDPLLLANPSNRDFLQTPATQRFLVNQTQSSISVMPRLADRAMVIRPGSTLSVLPGENTELYVSTQLWLGFSLKDNSPSMYDVPLWLPSDSWFGESNMLGEVCYAKYSEANVELSSLKKRSHRVFSGINIINEHDQTLHIHRIKMPMPLLDLYVDEQAQFWTDSICLTHNEDNKKPSFAIKKLSQGVNKNAYTMLTGARVKGGSNVFVRSIRSLIA